MWIVSRISCLGTRVYECRISDCKYPYSPGDHERRKSAKGSQATLHFSRVVPQPFAAAAGVCQVSAARLSQHGKR